MKIQVTRRDPLAGIPDAHPSGFLSRVVYDEWPAVFEALRGRKVPLTPAHEEQLMAHPDTQFSNPELILQLGSAFMCNVQYDVSTFAEPVAPSGSTGGLL